MSRKNKIFSDEKINKNNLYKNKKDYLRLTI